MSACAGSRLKADGRLPDKAVHHYAGEPYRAWSEEGGERNVLKRPGAFGENIATIGLTEDQVAVGDVFALGEGDHRSQPGAATMLEAQQALCGPRDGAAGLQ